MLKVKGLILAAAVVMVSAMPAAAQSGLGAGLSVLGDDGGVGVIVDYSQPLQGDHGFNWLADLSFFPGDYFSTLMLQGGARVHGQAAEKVNWLAHGMIGLIRQHADGNDFLDDFCDEFDLDCDASNTSAVLTIGGGLEYALSETSGLRGQLDFPIALSDGGGSTTRFSIMYVWRSK